MKTLRLIPGQNLVLGHRGENLATSIIFTVASWVDVYGFGTVHLLHQRAGDAEPYPVATMQNGTEVSWLVTEADTAVAGYGKYEIRYCVGETLVKSSIGQTFTREALQGEMEPPDPIKDWVDHVLEKESEIYEAVNKTEANSDKAVAAATDALKFANAAEASTKNAATSEQNASAAEQNAKASEDAAKASETAALTAQQNAERSATAASDSAEEAKKAAESAAGGGSGINVTAKPGQILQVEEVDENGNPTKWKAIDPVTGADWNAAEGEPGHVLNRTHWVEDVMVEILPETAFAFDENSGMVQATAEALHEMVVGETYIVNFRGTEYSCVAYGFDPGVGFEMICVGNLAMNGGDDTGEPFLGSYAPATPVLGTDKATVGVATYDNLAEGTVSIYQKSEIIHQLPGKFLPDGVPYVEYGEMVEVLPKCQPEYTDDGFFITENIPTLVPGETYAVNWNGTEYKCIALDMSAFAPGAVLLGNGALMGMPDTGEPFLIAYGEEAGQKALMAVAFDGATELTISIYTEGEVVHKLPGKLLPDGTPYKEDGGGETDTLTFDGNIEGKTAIMVDAGMYFVNISNVYVDSSKVLGATVTIVSLVEGLPSGPITITENEIMDMTEAFGFPAYSVGELGIVLSQDATMGGITLPKGINVMCIPGALYISEIKAPSAIFIEKEIIHKLDNKFLDLEWLPIIKKTDVEVLPETTSTEYSNNKTLKQSDLSGGMDIAVIFDGKRYECTVKSYLDSPICHFGNMALGAPENPNTGEPFFFMSFSSSVAYNLTAINENEHTFSIYRIDSEYNVIPDEFLPDDIGITYKLSKSGSTITLTGSDGSTTSVADADTTYTLGSFGVTVTADELNYVAGVTSSIQEQLDSKASVSYVDENLALKPGKNIAGEEFEFNKITYTAQNNTEIFNDYKNNKAYGQYSHAEGYKTVAIGQYSHAEGYDAKAIGYISHAEGSNTTASGQYSHAQGNVTTASGEMSHAEGSWTKAIGYASHAEGYASEAIGQYSHAEGWYTKASGKYQHVQGKHNIEDPNSTYVHIVGNGTANDARSNAHTIDWDGNAWFAGEIYVGGTGQEDPNAKKLSSETWTFTLADGSTVEKKVVLM